jgi:hypothetical protein
VAANSIVQKPITWAVLLAGGVAALGAFRRFDLLVGAIVPVVVLVVFALARKHLLMRPERAAAEGNSPEELDARFLPRQWLVTAAMIAIGVVFALLTHAALAALNQYLADADGPSYFQLLPQSVIWWFFPSFGALTISWELTLLVWSAIGSPDEATLYNDWSARRSGFDSPRFLRWMALAVAAPIFVLTALAVPMNTEIQENDISVHGYAFRNQTYLYSDARQMALLDGVVLHNGSARHMAGVVLLFADGRRWSSADAADFRTTVDPNLLAFLERKTGLRPVFTPAPQAEAANHQPQLPFAR